MLPVKRNKILFQLYFRMCDGHKIYSHTTYVQWITTVRRLAQRSWW